MAPLLFPPLPLLTGGFFLLHACIFMCACTLAQLFSCINGFGWAVRRTAVSCPAGARISFNKGPLFWYLKPRRRAPFFF
jgi:hypothetical protein